MLAILEESPETIAARQLRMAGLRATAQRVIILRVIGGMTGHPTLEEIYRAVRRRLPTISLNTVYKTLNVLHERDVLMVAGSSKEEAMRFEVNRLPHHHAICLGCRRIMDITDPALDALRAFGPHKREFTVVRHRVEFFGYCADCGRREKRGLGTIPRRRAKDPGRRERGSR